MEEITIGTGLTLSGGTLSATAAGILHGIASGTDTYTVTIAGATAYADGDAYLIRFTNGNTTSATLNINSLGAINLYRNNDGALIGGDIINGGEMLCIYNSTNNNFQVIGTAPNSLFAYVTNADSVTLTKGMPVYAFSGAGDRMTVKRANNSADATSAQTVGLVLSTSIAAGQKGLIMMQGLLDGLSILPTSTFADGDAVYLGATAGTITNVKPYAPNHLVYLGVVTTASNGSAGRMYVRIQNGYELAEIHDVALSSVADKQLLSYDSATSLWKNKSVTTADIASSTNKNYVTDAQATVIGNTSGTNTGNETTATIKTKLGAANTSTDGYLTSTDWNTFNNKLTGYLYKLAVPPSAVTGTLSETQILQLTIPANTFSTNDLLSFTSTFVKTGTLGTFSIRVKISTSATMPSGTTGQIAVVTIGTASLYANFERRLMPINSGNIYSITNTTSAISDTGTSVFAITSQAFDATVTNYLYISVTNSSTADSVLMRGFKFSNI